MTTAYKPTCGVMFVKLLLFAAITAASGVSRLDLVYEIADVAFTRLVMHNCYEQVESASKCNEIADVSPKDVRLYFGGLLPDNQTVVAVMPDNDAVLTTREHHAFLVLDPFPAYKFGHPVFMFYVDVNVSVRDCEIVEGIYTGQYLLTLHARENPLVTSPITR